MNQSEKLLLFAIGEAQPCTFAEISMLTRKPTASLLMRLDELQDRGFITRRDGKYSLVAGVKDHLVSITEGAAVI